MSSTDQITSESLKQLGFIHRPDFVRGNVDDCWSYRNLILYSIANTTGWHVQVGYMLTPAVLLQQPLVVLHDVQIVFRQANGSDLVI